MPVKAKDVVEQGMKQVFLPAIIMIFAAQLNLNLLINGFKISLAVICLPIFMFLFEDFLAVPVTLITAPGILVMRCLIEWLTTGTSFVSAAENYAPEMVFYLCYGGLFALYTHFIKLDRFSGVRLLPLVAVDMISNIAELLVRTGGGAFHREVLLRLLIVGVGRTALAAVCLAAFDAYGLFILRKDERLRYRRLLLLTSQLKSEMIWMNKNTSRIEETMAVSYSLYNDLNGIDHPLAKEAAQKALTVAKDIHEVKKEYYLIMNGISDALSTDQEENGMWMKNVFEMMQESARHLFGNNGQNIKIDIQLEKNFYTDKHYYLMSVLRNLINNAAEAAGEHHARIVLSEREEDGNCVIRVHDDCGGIDEEYLPTIFEPGFSTKINFETGQVSRGLGLSLVKDIVESQLGGSIAVASENGCTDFVIRIPKKNLEAAA